MKPGFRNIVLTPQLIENVERLQRALGERDHDRLSLNDTIAFAIWRALAEVERAGHR